MSAPPAAGRPAAAPPGRWRAGTELLLVALLGAAQTLAFVQTAAWPLPLLALVGLVWRLNQSVPRRAALLGWCYGTAWLVAGVWWLFISMHRYGGLPAPLAAGAVLALCAALSLYLALACALYARWRSGRLGADALLFAALWFLAEWARGVIFTGFPWLAAGYSQVDGPLAALAPWVGVYGVGALMAWAAALWAGLGGLPNLLPGVLPAAPPGVRQGGRRAAVGAAVLAVVTLPGLAGPPSFTQPAGSFNVALLQPNVRQDEKFAADRMPEALAWVAQQLLAARADLVVTPETAVPLLPGQLEDFAPGYWDGLRAHFNAPGRAALVGVPLGDFDRGYTNSVVGLSAGVSAALSADVSAQAGPPTAAYRYDKQHLVPFGEFIPTGFRWFTELMNIPLGDFSRGVRNPPSFVVGAQRVAPNICYEDLFGEELARRFTDPALAPTVFANVSNIGWFGNTIAIDQHRNISRFRTLEFQRPMVRATNTGATAVIDHRGQVLAELPRHTQGVLQAQVEGRIGTTPFAWWAARAGLWPLWVAAVGVCLLALRRGRVQRP